MTSLENLFDYYNHLPESSTMKAVLRRCLENIHQLGSVTIYELAELCYTSPATISRLVKALGYRSFSVFQTSLSEHCAHYDFHNRFSVDQIAGTCSPESLVLEGLRFNLTEFEREVTPDAYMPLVDALHQAKSVTIFAYGIYFMENVLQSDLVMSGVMCDIVSGDNSQIERCRKLSKGDLAIYMFPDTVESASTLRTSTEIAKRNGVTLALLSSTGRQPFQNNIFDFTLSFNGRHYMSDSFYLEMLLSVISIAYRKKYLDDHRKSRDL